MCSLENQRAINIDWRQWSKGIFALAFTFAFVQCKWSMEVDFTCSWDSASCRRWVRAANSSSVMKLSLRHEADDPGRGEGPAELPEPPPLGTHEPPPDTPEPPPDTSEPPELGRGGPSGRLGSVRDGSTWWVCGEDPDVAVAVAVTWLVGCVLSLRCSAVDWLTDNSCNSARPMIVLIDGELATVTVTASSSCVRSKCSWCYCLTLQCRPEAPTVTVPAVHRQQVGSMYYQFK